MCYIVLFNVYDYCYSIKYIYTRALFVKVWVLCDKNTEQCPALTVTCITNNINHLRALHSFDIRHLAFCARVEYNNNIDGGNIYDHDGWFGRRFDYNTTVYCTDGHVTLHAAHYI